jgi:hypothetical protein
VREAWAAVEAEERHAGAVADAPVPDAPAGNLYVTRLARGGDSTSRGFAAWTSAERPGATPQRERARRVAYSSTSSSPATAASSAAASSSSSSRSG